MRAPAARSYPWYYAPLNWLLLGLAHLPLGALYVMADGLYYLLAYGLRYRGRVVQENLRNSFPDKGEEEIRHISRAFYRHFTQLIVEILKLAAISPAELARRAIWVNPELMAGALARQQPVITLGSHMGNWEWILGSGALALPGVMAGVYKPFKNPFVEAFMWRVRTRTGAEAVPMLSTLRYLVQHRRGGRNISLLTDQAAGPEDRPYWTNFLHQDTGFYSSAERLVAQFDCTVLYVGIRRLRRGYYEIKFTEMPAGPAVAIAPAGTFPITEAFARQLERDIQASPEQYLWTHRRWKHKRVKM